MEDYENGLCRIGTSSKKHLINPVPNGIRPWCKPHGTKAPIHPAEGTEPDCGRCIRKDEAQKRKATR